MGYPRNPCPGAEAWKARNSAYFMVPLFRKRPDALATSVAKTCPRKIALAPSSTLTANPRWSPCGDAGVRTRFRRWEEE